MATAGEHLGEMNRRGALATWLNAHNARLMWQVRPERRNQTVSLYVMGPSTCIVTQFDDGSFDVYTSLGTLDIPSTLKDAEVRMDLSTSGSR